MFSLRFKGKKLIFDLFNYYPESCSKIIGYFSNREDNKKNNVTSETSKTIVVEGVYDPLYFSLFGAIIIDLKKKVNVSVDFLWVHSISSAVGVGFSQLIYRNLVVSYLRSLQWFRAYRNFCDNSAYFSNTPLNPILELKIFLSTKFVYKNLKSLQDISSYVHNGVLIGDLIIDTYLRFRPSPKFNVNDKFVEKIISQALRDLEKADRYFSKKRPSMYLTSHSTYIQHGIPVRVALKYGVDVRSFAGPHLFYKKLSHTDFYHSLNCDNYRKNFSNLNDQKSKKISAELLLKERFSGKVDPSTSYMRVSAYKSPALNNGDFDVRGHVIIFLHDFYDSPHFYADFIFPDFWTWLVKTIEILSSADIRFSIKPHPNQTYQSSKALELLTTYYSNLNVLPAAVSNKALVEGGAVCGVTVFGTVAHELAYLGIPTICCAKHAHHQYDFCRTATSFCEYKKFLLTADLLPAPVGEMRDQALEFVYMQNLHFSAEERGFREKLSDYYSKFMVSSPTDNIERELNELRNLPYYQQLVDDMCNVML